MVLTRHCAFWFCEDSALPSSAHHPCIPVLHVLHSDSVTFFSFPVSSFPLLSISSCFRALLLQGSIDTPASSFFDFCVHCESLLSSLTLYPLPLLFAPALSLCVFLIASSILPLPLPPLFLSTDRIISPDVLESVMLEAAVKLIPNLGHFSEVIRAQTLSLLIELATVFRPISAQELANVARQITSLGITGGNIMWHA